MKGDRVLITGVGAISALALDAQTHFQRLLAGDSGVRISPRPEMQDLPVRLEASVTEFDRRALIADRVLRKLLSPSAAYAVVAAGAAIQDAGLEGQYDLLHSCGLYLGSIAVDADPEVFIPAFKESLNQQGDFEIDLFATRGMKLLDPLFLVKSLPNAGLCGISIQHRVYGPNLNLTNGPISGLQAIALAAAAIRRGEAELALAGGYDSLLRMDSIAEHLLTGRLSSRQADPAHACRPFDEERDGFAVGEGAAFVLLEAASHARQRAARTYAEILGVGHTSDLAAVGQSGSANGYALEQAARLALQQANTRSADVQVIFGDGLATETDDLREASVVHNLVAGAPVTFTAATAALGFTGAASGAFSLLHAALALPNQVVPPLINCHRPDARCDLHFVTRAAVQDYERALIWNSDAGRKNVAVLMGVYRE